MLEHLITGSDAPSAEIVALDAERLDAWLEQQTKAAAAWVRAIGFNAKPGEHCLVPGDGGRIATVLLGIASIHDPWAYGGLPTALPEGDYRLAESGAVNNCLIEVFRSLATNDVLIPGESMTLSIVKFQTPDSAVTLFESTLASVILSAGQIGDLAEVQQGVIGANSYLMDIKVGGIGAIIVYVSDTVFISISSTSDSEGNALLNGEQLVIAAQGVQSRLPR